MESKEIIQNDKEILLKAYKKVYFLVKGKYVSRADYHGKSQALITRIDRVLMTTKYSISSTEKKKAIMNGKSLYLEYCSFAKNNPEGVNDQLRERAEILLDAIASFEAQEMTDVRALHQNEGEIDLELIFNSRAFISSITNMNIARLVNWALYDFCKEGIKKPYYFYITPKGSRYHTRDCIFCRGKALTKIDVSSDNAKNLKPCRCINDPNLRSSTITAFVDESRRPNPARIFDSEQSKQHNVISYVICKGAVLDEAEIAPDNIIEEDAYISVNSKNLELSIYEAFAKIMMRAAIGEFGDRLIIYSDNLSACERWVENKALVYLAKQFKSVKIEHVNREKNKYADRLGRKVSIIKTDKSPVEELSKQKKELDTLRDELEFVKKYFPFPRYMIPNLVEELSLLSGERIKEEKENDC